jgi:hypothetical protein
MFHETESFVDYGRVQPFFFIKIPKLDYKLNDFSRDAVPFLPYNS